MDSLIVRIPLIKPDIIITAGPDGDTHHSEHIVVGATLTELLLAERKLLYKSEIASWQETDLFLQI